MAKRKRRWWTPFGQFSGHIAVGMAAFVMLCTASIGLSLLMHSVKSNFQVPPFTLLVLTGLEDTIVIVDAVLFAVYFAVTAVRATREMLK